MESGTTLFHTPSLSLFLNLFWEGQKSSEAWGGESTDTMLAACLSLLPSTPAHVRREGGERGRCVICCPHLLTYTGLPVNTSLYSHLTTQ